MPSRQYQVEAENILPEGFWPGEQLEAGDDTGALQDLLLKAGAVLEMVGGVFTIMAVRRELVDVHGNPTGMFVPEGYRAKWESYAPAHRAKQPQQPEPEVQVEPEPQAEIEAWPEDAERALAETT